MQKERPYGHSLNQRLNFIFAFLNPLNLEVERSSPLISYSTQNSFSEK